MLLEFRRISKIFKLQMVLQKKKMCMWILFIFFKLNFKAFGQVYDTLLI